MPQALPNILVEVNMVKKTISLKTIIFSLFACLAVCFCASAPASFFNSEEPQATARAQTLPTPPSDLSNAYYYFLRACNEMLSGNFTKAETEMRTALTADADNTMLKLELARLMLHMRNLSEAVKLLTQCVQDAPDLADAHKMLAAIYQQGLGEEYSGEPPQKELWDKTIHEYEEVLRLDPDDEDALYSLGKMYFSAKNVDVAEKYLERYSKKNTKDFSALYYLTLIQFQKGNMEKALETIKLMEESHPDYSQVKMLKADIYEKLNRREEATKIYQSLINQGASSAEPYLRYARLLWADKELDKALDILDKFKKIGEPSGDIDDLIGQVYQDKYLYDKAISAFKDAIAIDPSELNYRYHLALAYAQMGDALNAIPVFQMLLKDANRGSGPPASLAKNKRIFLYNLGFLYIEARKNDQALEIFQQLIIDYPNDQDPIPYIQIAEILRGRKKLESALSILDSGISKIPGNDRLYNARALVLTDMGKANEVIQEYKQKLTTSKPADSTLHLGLIAVYSNSSKWVEALSVNDEGLKIFPDDKQLLFQKGSILEKTKKLKESEATFLQILKSDEKNSTVLNYVGYLLIDNNIDVERGMRYIQKALQIEPVNPAYLDSLGWGHFKKKDYTKALELLQRATKGLPDDPVIADHIGDVHVALGHTNEAADAYRKSIALQQDSTEQKKVQDKLKKLKPKLIK